MIGASASTSTPIRYSPTAAGGSVPEKVTGTRRVAGSIGPTDVAISPGLFIGSEELTTETRRAANGICRCPAGLVMGAVPSL